MIDGVIEAIDYIEEHLSEKLDLDIVANAVHYSKYHLHRIFTDTVGLTIHGYVQRRQLTEAAKLLVFSRKPILDIALLAGYETQQSFTKIFKAMYKQTPNQFRERNEYYPLQLKFALHNHTVLLGGSHGSYGKIRLAMEADISIWMALVHLVVDGFPNLIEEDYTAVLKQYIREKRALIMTEKNIAVGIMLFSNESIDFLGVHPFCRRQGIAKAFLDEAMNRLLSEQEISITTYREGDKADTGYRKALMGLGFKEAELLTEFGYPTQRFVLPRRMVA